MSLNWWGVILSYVFVFAVIGIAGVLLRRRVVDANVSRKLVHIGVSHWWFLAMFFFDRWQFAVIGPISFILINLASYLFSLMPAMEHETRSKNLGTVYFPVSLLALVLLSWAGPLETWVAGLGILIMGYGDGFASLFGEAYPRGSFQLFGNRKTLMGTVMMFVISAAVVVFFCTVLDPARSVTGLRLLVAVLSTAALATAVETVTPFGLDNITVPVLTAGFFHLVLA